LGQNPAPSGISAPHFTQKAMSAHSSKYCSVCTYQHFQGVLGGDEFICKIAKTVDDAKVLVENGFDYVTDIESMKLFRKRK
jgi:hypothetical protein